MTSSDSERILNVLRQISTGPKDLIIDPALNRLLDHSIPTRALKGEGKIENIYKLDAKFHLAAIPSKNPKLFLLRPIVANVVLMCAEINSLSSKEGIHVVFVPRFDLTCGDIIEEEGLDGIIQIHSLPIYHVKMDSDLYLLFQPDFFSEFHHFGVYAGVSHIVESIASLELALGTFEGISVIGDAATTFSEALRKQRGFLPEAVLDDPMHLILVDRKSDLVSALASQVTYEGLLDVVFGLDDGFVRVGEEIGQGDGPVIRLYPPDTVYNDIRDLNFAEVGGILKSRVRALDATYEERKTEDLSKLRVFVGTLSSLQSQHRSIQQHIAVTEAILAHVNQGDYFRILNVEFDIVANVNIQKTALPLIEELIFRQTPLLEPLRLMCLLSVVNNGIEEPLYQSLRTSFLHAYGFEHLVTFDALATMGFLTISAKSPLKSGATYAQQRDKMRLIRPDESKDIRYSRYFGFASLSVALIEQTVVSLRTPQPKPQKAPAKQQQSEHIPKKFVVYFLGGVAPAEMAALRDLARTMGVTISVVTTDIISGRTFLEHIVDSFKLACD